MGIYDRQYYRDGDQPQGVHLGGARTMVITLVVINALFYLANMFTNNMFFGDGSLKNLGLMTLKWDTLLTPWRWWEMLSYGFAHSPKDIWHIVGNMFVLWMFGRSVEPIYGRKEFLRFYLVAIVLGGLVWAIRQSFMDIPDGRGPVLLGASGAVTAVLILFIFHYPKQMVLLMFFIPAPAWVLGVIVIGSDLMRAFSDTAGNVAVDVHLVGALFAICYFKFRWNIGRLLPWGGSGKRKGRPLVGRLQSKLRLHDPDADSRYRKSDEQADAILDKLHREGEESLSAKERRILEDYSRRMRQKHR